MSTIEITIAVLIHLIVPLFGLLAYVGLVRRMKKENVFDPPVKDLFLVFVTYGGLLTVVLTSLMWKWSALASLGSFYLIFVGPIFMGYIAYKNRNRIIESKYHMWTYKIGILYFPFLVLGFILSAAFGG